MRIAIVGPYPRQADLTRGGVQASVMNLALMLAAIPSNEVLVIADPDSEPSCIQRPTPTVSVRFSRRLFSHKVLDIFAVVSQICALRRFSPDIVHLHGSTPFVGFFALILSCFTHRVVFTLHGIATIEAVQKYEMKPTWASWLQMKLYVIIERQVLRSICTVVVDTSYVEKELRRLRLLSPSNVVRVIPQGIDVGTFRRANNTPPAKQPTLILSVGVFAPRKGHLDLIRSFAIAHQSDPSLRLAVAGVVSDDLYFNSMRVAVARAGIAGAVDFYPNLARSEVLSLFESASVFALASLEESQGIAVCEAMAFGLHIVCTRVGGLVDVVIPSVGVLVPRGDLHAFAHALIAATNLTESKRAEIIKASERYNWHNLAGEVSKVYYQVACRGQ